MSMRTTTINKLPWIRALVFLLFLFLFVGGALAGPAQPLQEEAPAEVDESADAGEAGGQEEEPAAETGEPVEATEEEPAAEQKSFKGYFSDWNWLKWVHDWTESSSRGAARWFDGFFGSSELNSQADVSFGRLSTGLAYNEREGIGGEFRIRMRFVFPEMNNKFNMMVGRMNADDYISDSSEGFESMPSSFNTGEEDDWLLGFGYNPISRRRSNLSFSVGTKFSWPLEPYVKARYYYKFITGSRSQIRTQETVYWISEEGFGSQTNFNFEYMPGQRHLIRWANGLEVSEIAQGLIWQSRLTLYQNLSDKRAMAYQIGARGETDMPDPIEYYGFRLVYRQNALWDWFFWEARTGVNWPRNETLETPSFYEKQPHEAVPFVYFGIEMFFGKGPKISRSLD